MKTNVFLRSYLWGLGGLRRPSVLSLARCFVTRNRTGLKLDTLAFRESGVINDQFPNARDVRFHAESGDPNHWCVFKPQSDRIRNSAGRSAP
jgi:hypothetical protein